MRKLWFGGLVGAALSLCAASANADTIGLYNTGVDASGNVLSPGSIDSHWVATGGGGITYVLGGSQNTPGNNFFSGWAGNGIPGFPSAWVFVSTTNPTPVATLLTPITFTLTFNITGTISNITGTWYTDDNSNLLANGTFVATAGQTSQGLSFIIPAGDLHDGSNMIAVSMFASDDLYNGVRVNFDSPTVSAGTPLPAALPLFATGIGALGLLGGRRKRKAQVVA